MRPQKNALSLLELCGSLCPTLITHTYTHRHKQREGDRELSRIPQGHPAVVVNTNEATGFMLLHLLHATCFKPTEQKDAFNSLQLCLYSRRNTLNAVQF